MTACNPRGGPGLRRLALAGALAFSLGLGTSHHGAALGSAVPPALNGAQQEQALRIQQNLRCPICTGQPISESPNDISREMRLEVEQQVAAGRSDRQIYDYFAARYGQFVLLDPPKEGRNLLLWLAPVAALGAGGYWLTGVLRRQQRQAGTGSPKEAPATAAEADLPADPYLAQVRFDTAAHPDAPAAPRHRSGS